MKVNSKFPMGKITADIKIISLANEDKAFQKFVDDSLLRYSQCDWGETNEEDRKIRDGVVACFVEQNPDLVYLHYNKSAYIYNENIAIQIITNFLVNATHIVLL